VRRQLHSRRLTAYEEVVGRHSALSASRLKRTGLWWRADIVVLQQEPKHKPVCDQEQRYHDGRNEIGGTQLARHEPDRIALIESVEEIGATPQVEYSDQEHAPPAAQPGQCQQSKDRGNEIAVCGWAGESG
jgi:hypothetical protein